ELPDSFDMFSPVSTRAGPKTHTRVLYVVQPFLGLTTVKEYQDIIARLEQSERDAIEFTNNSLSGWRNWRARSQLNRETKNAYSAEIRGNRRRMFELERELKQFAYLRSQRRMLNRNISSEFSKEQLNEMLDDELKYLLENISDRDEAALGWIRGEASIYRAAEISANEIRNSLFQLSASRALYTNQFKPTVPEVYTQFGQVRGVSRTIFKNRFPEHQVSSPIQVFTPEQAGRSTFSRKVNYVVREDGSLILGRQSRGVGGGHIDLAGGRPVLAAGEVKILNGKVIYIDNSSGHYMPSGSSAQAAAEAAFRNANLQPASYIEKIWNGVNWVPKGTQ
ncbi:MAG: hypothetical protein LAT83_14345, partial [Kiritimatiellae bacterium]|nr:hypothetical protein [Kiritimatiellia bacterium]